MTTTTDNARNQARAQLESIIQMVTRLEHAQECNDEANCSLDMTLVNQYEFDWVSTPKDWDRYHDDDQAREAIQDDPLSVEILSGWHSPGSDPYDYGCEFRILLCTGGPAVCLQGDLGEHQEPDRIHLMYQDWGTPWTEYPMTDDERGAALTYAAQFYFGE